jgi:hypothetical protein
MGDGICKGNMNKMGIQMRRMANDQRHKEQARETPQQPPSREQRDRADRTGGKPFHWSLRGSLE